jgi:hypothetical protein
MFTPGGLIVFFHGCGQQKRRALNPAFSGAALLSYPLSFEGVFPLLRRCINSDDFNRAASGVAASSPNKEVISI